VDLLGVQLAQSLIVLAALAVLLISLLGLIQRTDKAGTCWRLMPIAVRQPARRARWRQVAFDPAPLPSRDPPSFPPPLEFGSARVDDFDAR